MANTVLVLGGRGYLGKRVRAALADSRGLVVASGSRRGPVVVDVNDDTTFAAMDGFDIVVNCSDSVAAPPVRAAEYCLTRGITFVESAAHAGAINALLSLRDSYANAPGSVVAGVGLFPGLSNLLAHRVVGDDCEQVELGIAVRTLCGAGKGIANLMVDGFSADAWTYHDRKLRRSPALSPGPTLDFGSRPRPTLSYDFPEAALLHASTAVPAIASYYAPLPRWLRPLVRAGARLRPARPGRLQRAFDWLTFAGLRVMRGLVFRWRASRVEIVAIANRGREVSRRATLITNDAIGATAVAVAAATVILCARTRRPRGVHTVGEVFQLGPFVAQMRGWNVDLELGLEGDVDTELVELTKLAHQ